MQLSQVLEAVLAQTLLPRIEGKGRIAAFEILITNAAIRNLIRNSKTHEIPSIIQLGAKEGMLTLNQCLADLVRTNKVAIEEAIRKSSNIEQLKRLINS
jgi:twitching motility protein PilT